MDDQNFPMTDLKIMLLAQIEDSKNGVRTFVLKDTDQFLNETVCKDRDIMIALTDGRFYLGKLVRVKDEDGDFFIEMKSPIRKCWVETIPLKDVVGWFYADYRDFCE